MIATKHKIKRPSGSAAAPKAFKVTSARLGNRSSLDSLSKSAGRWSTSMPDDQLRTSQGTTLTTFTLGVTSGTFTNPITKPLTEILPPLSAYRAPSDALSLYLREVGEVALLTRAEETVLARRIQAGDDQAREHMIRANLRLVVKIARDYENLGVPLLDLINEGNIGLMKAVERFDPDKGAKLSSYGSWWIKAQIRRALSDQGKTIRIPSTAGDQIYQLRKVAVKLQEILGREASDAELAEELGLSVRRVTELNAAGTRPASLDAPLGGENSSSFAEVVPDENAVNPAQRTDDNDSISQLRELVGRLPEREAKIIRARFGLDDGRERTLKTIGGKLGVTRERIRQIQNLALTKLRQMLEQPPSRTAAA